MRTNPTICLTAAFAVLTCLCCETGAFVIDQVTDNGINDCEPAISGSNIVWSGQLGSDYRIFLRSGSSTVVLPGDQTFPAHYNRRPSISGTTVAWDCDDSAATYLYGYVWGAETHLLNGAAGDNVDIFGGGSIGGGLDVVWDNQTPAYSGVYLNATSPIAGSEGGSHPRVYAGKVVWQGPAGVYYFDGSSASVLPGSADGYAPDIWGTRVAWASPTGIWLYDLNLGESTHLADSGSSPAVGSEYVVWARTGIQAYDIVRDEVFQVSPTGSDPAISGANVCWVAFDGTDNEIYTTTVPEPATLAFLVLAGVAVMRRRH